MNIIKSNAAVSLCLLLASAVTASAATVTYTFNADVPTINGPEPGSFTLTVPDFVTGTSLTQFTGSDFTSCSAPGTGACIAEFSTGPSPISGISDDIGFGNDVCCFIYFFPDLSFVTPGTYTIDASESAGAATLTVSVSGVPEPGTLGLGGVSLSLVAFALRNRWLNRKARQSATVSELI